MFNLLTKSILVFVLLLVSCQSGSKLDRPPNIRYGEDPCDECYMLINETRYAAAYKNNQEETRRFDDIGCMLIYHNKHQENVINFWVVDFNTQNWLKTDSAVFIKSDSIKTPMGFGIIALENGQIAKEAQESYQGRILKFPELLELTKELYY